MHVSIAGSIDRSVDNAVTRGCTAFQIFTRNPRAWATKPPSSKDVTNFKEKLAASKIDRFATVATMPYLPNLSSPDKDPFARSLNSFIDELKKCAKLGIPYLVASLGNHKGAGSEIAIKNITYACKMATENVKDDVVICLQNKWGANNLVGSSFKEIGEILDKLEPRKRFGVCLDTCHAFAAGYDLRTQKTATLTLEKFDSAIGIEHLKILHLNDSKGGIGSNVDRHEHIGLGKIGEVGLSHIIKFANSKNIPIILETPIDDRRDDIGNIKKVKELA